MVKFFKDCLIRRSKKNKKQKIRDSVGIMKKKQGAALPLPVAKQNKVRYVFFPLNSSENKHYLIGQNRPIM